MLPSLDDYATDLLRHLGVEIVHNLHSRPDGSTVEELHIYSQPKHLQQVLGWVACQHETLLATVYEGSPPPF